MKSFMGLALGCLISVSAFAQSRGDIGMMARQVAREVQDEAYYLSESQKSEISRNLDNIRRVLRSSSGGYEQDQYSCVSRDDDGANPYTIALRVGIEIKKTGIIFKDLAGCQAGIKSIRQIRDSSLLCIARDNDGANPWIMASLRGEQVTRFNSGVFRELSHCQAQLAELSYDRSNQITLCVSRDDDGANPYVPAALDLERGAIRKGTATFRTIEECKRFLAQ